MPTINIDKDLISGIIITLSWMIADHDFRNLIDDDSGLSKEDSPEMKDARQQLEALQSIKELQ